MNELIKENEDVHSLELNGLQLIQNKDGFRFGIDAVLLSDFAKEIKSNSTVLDLCSGNGIISVLLSAKLQNPSITAVEIQPDVADLAKRNVIFNRLEKSITVICDNLNNLDKSFTRSSFDAIVCNPPYKKLNSGIVNDIDTKTIARHEVYCTLDDVVKISSFLLKPTSSLYMIHRPDRLCDIISVLRKYHLEPKQMRLVQPYANKAPNLLLIKAVKNANPFLDVMNNLIVYKDNGEYTEEILKIYNYN